MDVDQQHIFAYYFCYFNLSVTLKYDINIKKIIILP